MTTMRSRRALLLASAAAALFAAAPGTAAGAGEEPVEIRWEQLRPEASSPAPKGLVQHGQLGAAAPGAPAPGAGEAGPPAAQPDGPAPVVTAYDGKAVRIDGFVVPLEFEGAAVTEFLLVPYVGACIHVPPPPANQIIYVQSAEGVTVRGMFDPVTVTGTLTTASVSTELADVGYRIAAETVVPFVERRPRFAFEKYITRQP